MQYMAYYINLFNIFLEKTNNSCQDSFKIPALNYKGYLLMAGSACAGSQGYCDIFSKCRLVDEGSFLKGLEDLILNSPTSSDIINWFKVSN